MVSGVTLAAGYEPLLREIKSKPVNKTLSFSLFKGSSYSSKAYKDCAATVYIAVEKINNSTRTTVWDTTFDARQLKNYPSADSPHNQSVTIRNVMESKEQLEVSYRLIYSSKGSLLQVQSPALSANAADTLKIKL